MIKKILAGVILVFMAGIGIFGLVKFQFQTAEIQSIPDNNTDLIKEDEMPQTSPSAGNAVLDNRIISNPEKYPDQREITPSDSNVYQIGDTIDTSKLIFTVNSYHITKTKGAFDITDIKETPLDVVLDNEDNISNNYSYVIIDMTIKNKQSKEVEFYLNNLWLRFINKDSEYSGNNIYYAGQLRGYKDGQPADNGKAYFRRILKMNEERPLTLTYVISDEELDGAALLLKIWPSGAINYEDDSRFVSLVQENKE
ncbi:DUF4352 domain-containing protein [Murimonas intestini]|uniref:DUF4352 domain-containing protein n=1 Tax=Murimonas intestini TaxID=1337051 RepID=UPI0011DE5441|nr:DUF4352 domain-containing protein [Murimonas intestini]